MISEKIILYPNDILKKKTQNVVNFDKSLNNIINKMKKIMVLNSGVGLAANQVGLELSLFIAKPKDKFYVFINPEIISFKDEEIKEEGCLSIPNKWGIVKRYNEVKIKFYDLRGRKHTLKTKGLLAHIIQHEIDHLNGILFIEKALEVYDINSDNLSKDDKKN
jgi:peptide deformylase